MFIFLLSFGCVPKHKNVEDLTPRTYDLDIEDDDLDDLPESDDLPEKED